MIGSNFILIIILIFLTLDFTLADDSFKISLEKEYIKIQSPAYTNFNEQFIKDIESGLNFKIVQIIRLTSGNYKSDIYRNIISLRYDLWEEKFLFMQSDDPIKKLNDIESVKREIQKITRQSLQVNVSDIKTSKPINFEALYIINPISKEKSGIIKKWMAEKFVGSSSLEAGSETNSFFAGMVNTVVQTELDKNIYGADKHILIKSKKIDLIKMENK
jgi:hypothetical protein